MFHYELGFYLENRLFPLAENLPKGTKLLEIFLFNNKQVIQYVSPNLNELDDSSIITHTPQITKDEYLNKINAAKQYLTDGESYELNYTFPTKLVAKGDPFLLYQKLKRRQFTRYSAYFENTGNFVLSFSPELFWDWKGKSIQVKPMKGTARRKENYLEDLDVAHNLENSVKERAENVMITDLFRNDLAKISEMGTVEVNELFSAEALDSVWQMTSKVSATLLPDIQFGDMVTQLFPSGSVTGAPKIRSIELISELEKRIRGIYTGSIFTFEYSDTEIRSVGNVAIRTMTLTNQNGQLKGDYAVGSGITVLSDPSAEYEECLSKFSFLTGKDVPDFEILETIRFDSGRYRFLSLHLERMEWSSKRFQYPFDKNQDNETLESISQVASGLLSVRFLLNRK
ncbi:MAG: bifunctional anthranilate synthase component I family protein/class IV aminotransferase, partial [Leptospira sp.]|nr:bifunctional anthranilate synthase component I family protein/class IV aminotransferase [Leptospira sp.]